MKIFITNVQFPGHWAGTRICKETSVQPIHGEGCHELFCQEDHQALLREETGLNPVLSSPLHMKAKLMNNVSDVPERDWWRIACLGKLFNGQGGGHIAASVI